MPKEVLVMEEPGPSVIFIIPSNRNRVGFPEDSILLNDDTPIPFREIADDAFTLKTTLMKPYSQTSQVHPEKIYNCRWSRVRCVVEKGFCILQMRLQIFSPNIQQEPKVAHLLTMYGCILHNIILCSKRCRLQRRSA
ncbi:uncharacterized protein [Palaemon carinicauda]|uniref:uncharacterized protein n=1 Tax=Palaemon carinicauda TaxID=392227 RepID=UPI0035B5F247